MTRLKNKKSTGVVALLFTILILIALMLITILFLLEMMDLAAAMIAGVVVMLLAILVAIVVVMSANATSITKVKPKPAAVTEKNLKNVPKKIITIQKKPKVIVKKIVKKIGPDLELQARYSELNAALEIAKREKLSLQEKLKLKEIEFEQLKEEYDDLKKSLREKIRELDDKKRTAREDAEKVSSFELKLQRQRNYLESKCKALEEIEQRRVESERKTKRELSSIKRKLFQLNSKNVELEKLKKRLEKLVNQKNVAVESLREEKKSLKNQLKEITKEKTALAKELQKTKSKIERLNKQKNLAKNVVDVAVEMENIKKHRTKESKPKKSKEKMLAKELKEPRLDISRLKKSLDRIKTDIALKKFKKVKSKSLEKKTKAVNADEIKTEKIKKEKVKEKKTEEKPLFRLNFLSRLKRHEKEKDYEIAETPKKIVMADNIVLEEKCQDKLDVSDRMTEIKNIAERIQKEKGCFKISQLLAEFLRKYPDHNRKEVMEDITNWLDEEENIVNSGKKVNIYRFVAL
ncbi:hypothetical protein DRJ17_04985 [Candidatus Woesearchaeota archaeon]|nr:MAG: hypothetical protein DRJ17_04985 [Candidatus Woesearchaeota archaeon]